jgi:type I restriction enzyme S subunit
MKDSGVKWLGEIPEAWGVTQLKRIANIQTGNTPSKSNQSVFYSDDNGLLWIKAEDLGRDISIKTTSEYLTELGMAEGRIFPPHTVYVCCIASVGKVGYSDVEASCNQQINGLIFNELVIWKYGYYFTLAQENEYFLNASGNVMKIINTEKQSMLMCPIPSTDEQRKIVEFLDKKCSHIDTVIEKTKASIEEYKKLKQAVITQAVTKGVRGERPMKDSGIEWIGEIPEEWDVRRVKTLFDLRDEKNYLPLEEVNLISLYTDLGVVQHADLEKTSGNKASNADGYKIVKEDDIVVNIILCWMGAIGRSAFDGVTSPAYDIYVPKKDIVESRFYHYYFRTTGFSGDCYKRGRGIMAMRWRTYSDQFRDIRVAYPPIEEQREIFRYLDEKCTAIDTLIFKKEQFLTELETYKKSLIYEYVTGKKEVL